MKSALNARSRRGAALSENETSVRLRLQALEAAANAIVITDRTGAILWVNQAFVHLNGYSAEESIGQNPRMLKSGEHDDAVYADLWQTILAGRVWQGELINRRKDGSCYTQELTITPLRDATGTITHFVAIEQDVSERKRAEKALRDAARRKDEFLAMLGHELRNPLAPIRNAVHLLRLIGPHDPKLVQARDLVGRQVTHLARLVDDLMDISRITRGTITLRKKRVDLSTRIEEALETVRPLITSKRQTLTVAYAPQSLTVEADPGRLVQVLGNLLHNAVKFTDAGGWISVLTERRGRDAVIRIRDTGRGIAPAQLHDIFDIFVQGEASLARTEGGLGIGLALARHLIEQHGGTLEARSAGLGQGSEFIVRLPTAGARPQPEPPQRTETTRAPQRLRIMVVEDNIDVAASFIMLLETQGHEVRTAYTGPAAVELAATFVPHIAFVDLGLPGIDGYEVARRLRKLPAWQSTPLVALSGYGQDQDKRRARAAGFDHFLTKPVDPNIIDRLLIERRRLRARTTS